jgi:hypothetical protein
MADQRSAIGARPALRAAHALTRKVLPGQAAQVAERAVKANVAIAAAPAILIVAVLVVTLIAIIGAIGGGASSAAATCTGDGGSTAAPTAATAPTTPNAPPANLIPIYQAASTAAGLNPQGPAILAGINRVETGFGVNLGPSSAGAVGWMQFEPSTWEAYGVDANGDGVKDPNNPEDAIFAAARLLKANGAPQNWFKAIFAYNHATWYVNEVEGFAHTYAPDVPPKETGGPPMAQLTAATKHMAAAGGAAGTEEELIAAACGDGGNNISTVPGEAAKLLADGLAAVPQGAPPAVRKMIEAGNQIAMMPYVFGGHHELGSATNGYDCSSAVSYLMFAAGLLDPGEAGFSDGDFLTHLVSGDFLPEHLGVELWPGHGKWVTVYTVNEPGQHEHVYLEIAGVRFDDSSTARNGAGPNGSNISTWQPRAAFSGFTESHPRNL